MNHNLLASHDPRSAHESIRGVFFRHSLRTCTSNSELNFVHRGASLASLSFNFISYGADVEVRVDELDRSHYVIVLPLSGHASVTNRNHTSDLDQNALVVLDPSSSFKFEMLPDHSHLAVGIPKRRLITYLYKNHPDLIGQRIEFQTKPYLIQESSQSLVGFIAYLCQELDRPGSIAQQSFIAQTIEESFLSLAYGALCLNETPNTDIYCDSAEHKIVMSAEKFIETNLTEEIAATDIVKATQVPSRTLYRAYQKQHGIGPMSWLKLRRLRQARLDILTHAKDGISITDIAMRYQQSHVGRFSRAYFREFGELPSETLKHAKI